MLTAMPTSIGHGLAGIAAGWIAAAPPNERRARWTQMWILGAVAAAPYLDLLFGHHRAETHSVGAAAIVAAFAMLRRWPVAAATAPRWRIGAAVFLAYLTHPLLDALAFDTAPPIGIMAFWPFSREYVQSGIEVFAPVWRRWQHISFYTHNTVALIREILILAPICLGVWHWRGGRKS
jgi:membrane-bound metal-dependent hydrolase YbcI (DUF457 family)